MRPGRPGIRIRSSIGSAITQRSRPYVAAGHRHFALVLSDAEYRRVMRLIAHWQALPQPSYHLDRRNCVNFVAEIAATLGLQAVPDSATRRRPQAFLDRVARANGAIITARARTRSLAAR